WRWSPASAICARPARWPNRWPASPRTPSWCPCPASATAPWTAIHWPPCTSRTPSPAAGTGGCRISPRASRGCPAGGRSTTWGGSSRRPSRRRGGRRAGGGRVAGGKRRAGPAEPSGGEPSVHRQDDARDLARPIAEQPRRRLGDLGGRARLPQRDGGDPPGDPLRVALAPRGQHRGLGRPGRDGVDPDAERAVVVGRGAGEPDDRVLGGLVGAEPGVAAEAADAAGVDDGAAALAHRADLLAQAQPRALDVHGHDPVEVRLRDLVEAAVLVHARVVERAVEAAVAVERGVDEPRDVGRRAHVPGDVDGVVAVGDELVGEVREGLLRAGRQHDRRALPGEEPGGVGADPRARADQQDHLAGEQSVRHRVSSRPRSPSRARASSGVAMSRPSSRRMRTTFSTCSALLFARRPRSRYRLSSSPTRTCPPASAAAVANAIWCLPAAKQDSWWSAPKRRSAIIAMCRKLSRSAPIPPSTPKIVWTSRGGRTSPRSRKWASV